MNKNNESIDVICRYLLKPGMDSDFEALLDGHWQMLHSAGLTTDEPARIMQARDQAGNIAFIEMFAWRSAESVQTAHETPSVMKLWEPMGALCRDMEFWHVQPFGE